MQKLLKNWVFTLVLTILLLAFGIIMFTSLGEKTMNILIAAGLLVYIVLVLIDNVIHYRGKILVFAILELMVVTMFATGLLIEDFNIFGRFGISGVNGSVGFAMWLRSVVEIIHGYFLQSTEGKHRFSLPKMLICIAFLTLGVVLMCSPFIQEWVFRWGVGGSSLFGSLVMAFTTMRNRSDKRKRKKKKMTANDDDE